jgi:hypothetical protein
VQFVSAVETRPRSTWDNKPHECSQTWQAREFDQMMLENARA